MKRASPFLMLLAASACAPEAPPVVIDKSCEMFSGYSGNISKIRPDDARIWARGETAAYRAHCGRRRGA